MGALYNLARMTTATVGTGTITLGAAVPGFLTFAGAGVPTGTTVSYAIEDGANSEIGEGVYTSAGTTLTRVVTNSTAGGTTAIALSGTAQVFITPRKEDFDALVPKSGAAMTGDLTWNTLGTGPNFGAGSKIYENGSGLILRCDFDALGVTNEAATVLLMLLNATGLGIGVTPGLPLHVNRKGATSDAVWNASYFLSSKTTNMADGFGTGFRFRIADDAAVENTIGEISAVRAGADNTGKIQILPFNAGAATAGLQVGVSSCTFNGTPVLIRSELDWVTFTPTVVPTGNPAGFGVSNVAAIYCKIGRLVHERGQFTVTNVAGGGGLLSVSLAFTARGDTIHQGHNATKGRLLIIRLRDDVALFGTFAEIPTYPVMSNGDVIRYSLWYEAAT